MQNFIVKKRKPSDMALRLSHTRQLSYILYDIKTSRKLIEFKDTIKIWSTDNRSWRLRKTDLKKICYIYRTNLLRDIKTIIFLSLIFIVDSCDIGSYARNRMS